MHLSSENTQIKVLRQEKRHLEEDIIRKNQEIDKMEKRMKALEKDGRNMEEELRRANSRNQEQWQLEKKNIYE